MEETELQSPLDEQELIGRYTSTITKLKLLNKLRVNEKIIFSVPCITEAKSLSDWVKRKWYRESSETNLADLDNLFKEIAKLLNEKYLSDTRKEHLHADSLEAVKGISNLFVTYSHDKTYLAKLETQLREFTDVLGKYKRS